MKKLISAILAGTLALSLAACGSSASSSTAASSQAAATAESGGDLAGTTIRVAASPTPHAEILNVAKEILAGQGVTLEVVEFSDYVQPNMVTESGEVDANYFQHQQYLDAFNEENGTHLVSVGAIHYEPFGIYPGKSSSLDEIADGAVIAVPNDTTNEARALQLLAAQGHHHHPGRRRSDGHRQRHHREPPQRPDRGTGSRPAAPHAGRRGLRGHQRQLCAGGWFHGR